MQFLVKLFKMNNVLIGSLVICLFVANIQPMPSEMHTEDAYAAEGYFHRAYNNGYKQGVKDSLKGHGEKKMERSVHKPHPLHPEQYYHPEIQFRKPNIRTEYLVGKDRYRVAKSRRSFENKSKTKII